MYGDGMQVRDWLHVSDHAAGHRVRPAPRRVGRGLQRGRRARLLPNREVIGRLLAAAGRDWSLVRTVPDRPGHDRRYAMDGSKLAALGLAAAGAPSRRACPRRSPGTATTRSGSRAPGAATGTATTQRQYGDRLAAGRAVERQGRGRLSRCGSPSSGSTGGSGARWSRRSRTRPFTGTRGPDRLGPAGARPRHADRGVGRARSSTRERPEVVIHTAAWTDVDGCARDPELAMRRNGTAAGELARACAAARHRPGVHLDQRGLRRAADRRHRLRARRRAEPDQPVRRRARPRASAWRSRRSRPTARAAASASCGPRGSTARRATTSRPRSRPRRCGRGTPASRCRWSADEIGVPDLHPGPRRGDRRADRRGRDHRGAGPLRRSTTS